MDCCGSIAPENIHLLRDCLQMVRIDAGVVSAEMVHLKALRNLFAIMLVSPSVG